MTRDDFYHQCNEAIRLVESAKAAKRRRDDQAARALLRLAMVSTERAMRELPETAREETDR